MWRAEREFQWVRSSGGMHKEGYCVGGEWWLGRSRGRGENEANGAGEVSLQKVPTTGQVWSLGEGSQEGSTAREALVSSRSLWPGHGEWAGSKPASFWPPPAPRQQGSKGLGHPFADPLPSLLPVSPLPPVQIPTS